jgi:hypothetical protein
MAEKARDLAEGMGFEPTILVSQYNGLAIRHSDGGDSPDNGETPSPMRVTEEREKRDNGAFAVGAPHRRDRVWIVAYSKGERSEKARQHSQRPTERASRCGTILAYANFTVQADGKRREESAECERVRTANYGRGAGRWLGQWPAEPPVGRVVDGVPGWMDRVGALGNAVVPQIPEMIGRAIVGP